MKYLCVIVALIMISCPVYAQGFLGDLNPDESGTMYVIFGDASSHVDLTASYKYATIKDFEVFGTLIYPTRLGVGLDTGKKDKILRAGFCYLERGSVGFYIRGVW